MSVWASRVVAAVLLAVPLATRASEQPVDVEVFTRPGCPHCADLEPIMQGWMKTIPPDVAFVRVPVMFRYTWPMAGTSRPFVALGPSFGYQVKCDETASFNGSSVTESCDTAAEGDSQRKKFDVSGRAEAGLDFAMSGRTLSIGGAYSYGFTDVATHTNVKNRVFSIFLAIGL